METSSPPDDRQPNSSSSTLAATATQNNSIYFDFDIITSNLIYSNYITNERKLMKLGPMHRPAFRIPTLSNGMCQSSKTCDKSLRESASQSKAWQFTTNLCPKIFEKGEDFDELVTGDFDCLQYLHSSMMYFISYIWQAQ